MFAVFQSRYVFIPLFLPKLLTVFSEILSFRETQFHKNCSVQRIDLKLILNFQLPNMISQICHPSLSDSVIQYQACHSSLVAGLSPRMPGFDPRPVYMSLVADEVALRQVVVTRLLRFCPVSIISSVLHNHFLVTYTILFWQMVASLKTQ